MAHQRWTVRSLTPQIHATAIRERPAASSNRPAVAASVRVRAVRASSVASIGRGGACRRSRRRPVAVRPPAIPSGIRRSASSRHWLRTGQTTQTAFARSTPSPSWGRGKNRSGSTPRHAARERQSLVSAAGEVVRSVILAPMQRRRVWWPGRGGGCSPRRRAPAGRRRLDIHRGIKHKVHGLNVQVFADPAGRLIWASPTLPGARHDIGAAREHGIIDAITASGVLAVADTAYEGGGAAIRVPQRRRRLDPDTGRYRPLRLRSGRSTPRTPANAGRVSGPTPSSETGRSCARSVLVPAGPPPSSGPFRR